MYKKLIIIHTVVLLLSVITGIVDNDQHNNNGAVGNLNKDKKSLNQNVNRNSIAASNYDNDAELFENDKKLVLLASNGGANLSEFERDILKVENQNPIKSDSVKIMAYQDSKDVTVTNKGEDKPEVPEKVAVLDLDAKSKVPEKVAVLDLDAKSKVPEKVAVLDLKAEPEKKEEPEKDDLITLDSASATAIQKRIMKKVKEELETGVVRQIPLLLKEGKGNDQYNKMLKSLITNLKEQKIKNPELEAKKIMDSLAAEMATQSEESMKVIEEAAEEAEKKGKPLDHDTIMKATPTPSYQQVTDISKNIFESMDRKSNEICGGMILDMPNQQDCRAAQKQLWSLLLLRH